MPHVANNQLCGRWQFHTRCEIAISRTMSWNLAAKCYCCAELAISRLVHSWLLISGMAISHLVWNCHLAISHQVWNCNQLCKDVTVRIPLLHPDWGTITPTRLLLNAVRGRSWSVTKLCEHNLQGAGMLLKCWHCGSESYVLRHWA